MMPSTWTKLQVTAINESFIKDNKKTEVSIIGAAFDFKNFLKDRLLDFSKCTDNLCYRFAKNLVTDKVELHYKFMGNRPHSCGEHFDETVTSFKEFASLARGTDAEISLYCRKRGIDMPKGVPTGEPGIAKICDFTEAEGQQNFVNTEQVTTSNIRNNTNYSWHCRGEAQGDDQPLKKKKKSKSKADVILDTVIAQFVSHCGRNTDWYKEKEAKWRTKLSDLAQGTGQSAPPEWMPLPDEG